MKYFVGLYHAAALLHHVYAMKYTSEIEFSKSTDQRVTEIEVFTLRYFTSWNMIIQTIFLILALATDIAHLFPVNKYENKLLTVKGYIFTTFMFPCTTFVSGMFWSVYSINREWVLPSVVDAFVPSWLNHSIHTLILVPVVMEILFTNQPLPSFKSAFFGLSFLLLIYDILFYYTYYESGRWLYGLFYIFSWQERACFLLLNYVTIVILLKSGIVLQHFKGKCSNSLYTNNCAKLAKAL